MSFFDYHNNIVDPTSVFEFPLFDEEDELYLDFQEDDIANEEEDDSALISLSGDNSIAFPPRWTSYSRAAALAEIERIEIETMGEVRLTLFQILAKEAAELVESESDELSDEDELSILSTEQWTEADLNDDDNGGEEQEEDPALISLSDDDSIASPPRWTSYSRAAALAEIERIEIETMGEVRLTLFQILAKEAAELVESESGELSDEDELSVLSTEQWTIANLDNDDTSKGAGGALTYIT